MTATQIWAPLSSQALPNQKAGFFCEGGGGGGELVLFPTQAHYLQISQQWKWSKLGDKMSTKKDAAVCWEDTPGK